MTPEQLASIQARVDAATEGPWVACDLADGSYAPDDGTGWWWVWQESKLPYYGAVINPNDRTDGGQPDGSIGECMIDDNRTGTQEKYDADFIASARTDVPALLALVREQAVKLDEYEAKHGEHTTDNQGRGCPACAAASRVQARESAALTATEGAA